MSMRWLNLAGLASLTNSLRIAVSSASGGRRWRNHWSTYAPALVIRWYAAERGTVSPGLTMLFSGSELQSQTRTVGLHGLAGPATSRPLGRGQDRSSVTPGAW